MAGDTADFLRGCNIIVEIEHDVTQHLNRAIELINRTNQLNFVKSRLPEDSQLATLQLTTLLALHDVQAGLVRVVDRYGAHGHCGIYILETSSRLLPVWVSARGGCDLRAVCHYLSVGAFGSSGEFNFHQHGCDVRIDHSVFLRYAITGLPVGGIEACERLGYCEENFRTKLLDHRPGKSVWLLSFWTDADFAIYRHRDTGVAVPFMFPRCHDQATDVTHATLDDLPDDQHRNWLAGPLAYLKENFEYLGPIPEFLFKQNLKIILNAAPRKTRVFILTARVLFGTSDEHTASVFAQRVDQPLDPGGSLVAEEGDHPQRPKLRHVGRRGPQLGSFRSQGLLPCLSGDRAPNAPLACAGLTRNWRSRNGQDLHSAHRGDDLA